MHFGICNLGLGYTRLQGLLLYDTASRNFTETKPGTAKKMLDQGRVKGVLWDDDTGEFVPDPKFNRNDILVKSGCGNYRWLLHEVPGETACTDYMVVRVLNTNKGLIYELVSNKCQRVKLTEEQLFKLNSLGHVSGVFIDGDNIALCEGVVVEDRTYPDDVEMFGQIYAVEGSFEDNDNDDAAGNTEELTLEEIFAPEPKPELKKTAKKKRK